MKIVAAILAGGHGKRFHPYTEIIPKPMIPLGPDEKPVLEYIVKWISKFGIREFVFLVGYRWRYIYNYFEDGSRFNVRIRYSLDEENGYSNTGGAILKAYRSGLLSPVTLIWYGDIISALNVSDLIEYHAKKGGDLTLVVTKRYQVPVGVAKLGDDLRITEMEEKPYLDINATIGVAVLNTKVLDSGVEEELGRSFDFMGDLVPWLISKGASVYAYIYNDAWYDIGSLERYKKINANDIRSLFDSSL